MAVWASVCQGLQATVFCISEWSQLMPPSHSIQMHGTMKEATTTKPQGRKITTPYSTVADRAKPGRRIYWKINLHLFMYPVQKGSGSAVDTWFVFFCTAHPKACSSHQLPSISIFTYQWPPTVSLKAQEKETFITREVRNLPPSIWTNKFTPSFEKLVIEQWGGLFATSCLHPALKWGTWQIICETSIRSY